MSIKKQPIQGVEIVGIGHPDKIADWVSDLCVDFVKSIDPEGRAAFETLIKNEHFAIFGEYSVWHDKLEDINFIKNLEFYLAGKLKNVGYTNPKFTFELKLQSQEIAAGVDTGGAGDQGVIYNGATSDVCHIHPAAVYIETIKDIAKSIAGIKRVGMSNFPRLYYGDNIPQWEPGWDFKALLTFPAKGKFKPLTLTIAILCNAKLQESIRLQFIERIKCLNLQMPEQILFNAAGTFEYGGTYADAGATNRKLAVDNHYGLVPHGGGGLSGKDLTKVDRSATHYLRWVAIQLVEMMKLKTAKHISIVVGVTYAIGRKDITGLEVRLNGKPNAELTQLALNVFDFSPRHMEKKWKIDSYAKLAQSNPSTGYFSWNGIDAEVVGKLEIEYDKLK